MSNNEAQVMEKAAAFRFNNFSEVTKLIYQAYNQPKDEVRKLLEFSNGDKKDRR